MRRISLVLLLATGSLLLRPTPTTVAQEGINENPTCQQMFRQMADPVAAQMLWYTRMANAYPMGPAGRRVISPYPYAGYPGFGAIFHGPGGPSWTVANQFGAYGARNVLATNRALSVPTIYHRVAAQAASPSGGLPANGQVESTATGMAANAGQIAPGDLIGLGDLRQSLIGNVLGAADVRQSVISNRIAAADLNRAFTAYPLEQAVGLREIIEGIAIYVERACGQALPESNGTGGGHRH